MQSHAYIIHKLFIHISLTHTRMQTQTHIHTLPTNVDIWLEKLVLVDIQIEKLRGKNPQTYVQ